MTPTFEQFKKYASDSNVIPVYAELLADLETPVSVFAKVDNWGRYSFIGFAPRATFSLVGRKSVLAFADGRKVESTSEEGLAPLAPLRDYLASRKPARLDTLPRFFGGAVGYFGYECVGLFEKLPDPKGERKFDDAFFGIYDDIIIFDNLRHTAKIVACANIDEFDSLEAAYRDACARVEKMSEIYKSPRRRPLTAQNIGEIRLKSNMSHDDFCDMVERRKSI